MSRTRHPLAYTAALSLLPAILTAAAAPALAIDEAHRAEARRMADKAAAWLLTQQDPATGGWLVPPADADRPEYPAITALALNALLLNDDIDPTDPAILQAAKHLLNAQQPDGGIYDTVLPNYNTSIALSALAEVDLPQSRDAIDRGQAFLRKLQWSDADGGLAGDEAPDQVQPEHPFYGGAGYGHHGRPDMSNLTTMLQAMHDTGVSPDDVSFQRALRFMERCQMLDEVNDMPYADGSHQGGFIYATAPNAAALSVDGGLGQSQAGEIEETLDDGTKVSRLRAYGSMTYAGFKSYIYADLPRDDIRVTAALDWIKRNYTVEENPGLGKQGLYYYLVTFARALDAWGQPTLDIPTDDGTTELHDWANDLVDRLAELQNEDGSFEIVHQRWMEDQPVLITSYALIALEHALDQPTAAPENDPSAE